jgi:hypothetical protein
MDVLVRVDDRGRVVRDRGEPFLDLRQLVRIEQARAVEAPGVLRSRDTVVRQQLGVVRAEQLPDGGIEDVADAAGPERHSPILSKRGLEGADGHWTPVHLSRGETSRAGSRRPSR